MLYSHIIDVVNSFPSGQQRARYAQAAVSWRHPYWDWATPPTDGDSVYPSSLSAKEVNVTLPNGTATIPNPLYAYNFHPVSVSDFYYNPVCSEQCQYRQRLTIHSLQAGQRQSDIPLHGPAMQSARTI